MKSIYYKVILSVAIPLFMACSDNLDSSTQQMSGTGTEVMDGDVIVQKRNPNLPEVVTKVPTFEEGLTRNSTTGSSDKFLG